MARLIKAVMLALVVITGPAMASDGESSVVLVAHLDVETHRLTRDTTRALFAMRQRSWPDGQAVRVFVLNNDHPVHARFAKQHLGVYPHQLQLAWDRMVFSGTGQAPMRALTQADMLEHLATTPGALGYLEREYLDDRVQVIAIE